MNNLDFFAEYEGQKRRAERIFEALDKKINSNKDELDEALFGLIKGAKEKKSEREVALKTYFNKLLKDSSWQNYKIDIGGTEVEISKATPDQIEQAWEILRTQGLGDSFTGSLKQDGDTVIYQKGDGKPMKDGGQPNDQNQDDSQNNNQQVDDQNTLPAYQITYDKKSGRYFFGSLDRYVEEISNAPSEIETYNWQKSPLKFLFEDPLKFGLREIVFDFKEGRINAVRDGFWIGDFLGKYFEADFVGNNFRGTFFSNNEDWRSKPTAFISGTFVDRSKTGLLGLKDVKQSNEKYAFNLIQLPPNYSIEILTDKQLRHTITCLKRLDDSNTNFVYNVYMGYDVDSSDAKRVTITWEGIREKYEEYKVSSKMKSLPDLFSLNTDENIIELRVLEAGTPPSFKKVEKFDDTKEYIESTSNLRGLKQISGSQYNKNLKFDISSDSDLQNFNKIKGYINSPQFESDLKKASVYLDNKLISISDIKSKFPYLVNVFTSDVIAEATINLANPKKSYGKSKYSKSSVAKNPLTGKKFEEPYEIADYLNQKYAKEIEANGGRKTAKYQQEYSQMYNAIFGSKSSVADTGVVASDATQSAEVSSGTSKEEDVILKRIENFVKFFVYKIDDGKNTNKLRKYFIDLLKSKITAHKEPNKSTTTTTTTATQTPSVNPTPTASSPKKGAIGKLKEEVIRMEIRKIFSKIL